MESLVVSLHASKRLVESGYNRITVFGWIERPLGSGNWSVQKLPVEQGNTPIAMYYAPTAQEIADELPKTIEYQNYTYYLEMKWPLGDSRCQYWSPAAGNRLWSIDNDNGAIGVGNNMAESLAHLWLKIEQETK